DVRVGPVPERDYGAAGEADELGGVVRQQDGDVAGAVRPLRVGFIAVDRVGAQQRAGNRAEFGGVVDGQGVIGGASRPGGGRQGGGGEDEQCIHFHGTGVRGVDGAAAGTGG